MPYNLNTFNFNLPHDEGEAGALYFPNGYGVYVAKILYNTQWVYYLTILKQTGPTGWANEMDTNISGVLTENPVSDLTQQQVEQYIDQVMNFQ